MLDRTEKKLKKDYVWMNAPTEVETSAYIFLATFSKRQQILQLQRYVRMK